MVIVDEAAGGWQVAHQPQADTAGDVVTAQAVLGMHQPYADSKGTARCASASHGWSRLGPPFPCTRRRLAELAIDAHNRTKARTERRVTS